MIYSVKLDEQGTAQLLKDIGLPVYKINLKKGIIQVCGKDDIQAIADRYGIDNVDNVPYQEFLSNDTADKRVSKAPGIADKSQGNTSQQKAETTAMQSNARKTSKKISNKIEVGSVVMVKDKGKTMHLVVTDIRGNKYNGARMILGSANFVPNAQILLVKDKDVIYKNPTYKAEVIVTRKRVLDLKETDFIQVLGSRVVGKIINSDTMQQILELVKVVPKSVEKKATEEENFPQPKAEGSVCDKPNQEPHGEVPTSKTTGTEDHSDEEDTVIHFETAILGAKSYEEVISNLKLKEGTMLETAIICAAQEKQFSLKKLLPLLQLNYPKNSQNALKVGMSQELQEWIKERNVQMREASLVYFLKEVGRVIK